MLQRHFFWTLLLLKEAEKNNNNKLWSALYIVLIKKQKKKGEGVCARVCVYSNAESNRGPFANSIISLRFEREKANNNNVKRT